MIHFVDQCIDFFLQKLTVLLVKNEKIIFLLKLVISTTSKTGKKGGLSEGFSGLQKIYTGYARDITGRIAMGNHLDQNKQKIININPSLSRFQEKEC